MSTTTSATFPAILSHFNHPSRRRNNSHFSPHTFTPVKNSIPKSNPRLRIANNSLGFSRRGYRVLVHRCCGDSGSNGISAGTFDDSSMESSINIKLPRRSLLVQFTCNSCGESTKRLINKAAYERGTVFVQCSGCLQHHKLVDNLGLVVEYDFRNETADD